MHLLCTARSKMLQTKFLQHSDCFCCKWVKSTWLLRNSRNQLSGHILIKQFIILKYHCIWLIFIAFIECCWNAMSCCHRGLEYCAYMLLVRPVWDNNQQGINQHVEVIYIHIQLSELRIYFQVFALGSVLKMDSETKTVLVSYCL